MLTPARWLRLGTSLAIAVAGMAAAHAAPGEPQIVHPIYAQIPDAPQNDLAVRRFNEVARRFGLGPVEVVDVETPPPSKARETLQAAIARLRKLELDPALVGLDEVASEAAATGGAGLDAATLSDLYLHRAWAVSRADFNPSRTPASTARAQAYGDLLRAAMLAPGRELNAQQFPPAIVEDWARATAEIRTRPQATLKVPAAPEALVSVDGGPAIPGPASFPGLVQGDHLVRVDEPGFLPWGGTVPVTQPAVTKEIPARKSLSLPDAKAAAHARRMGSRFAMVAEARPSEAGGLTLALRLVDAAGNRRDAALAPLAGEAGALAAAVMRLDEEARRLDRSGTAPAPSTVTVDAVPVNAAPVLVGSPPPAEARLGDDPKGWASQHWPLLTAVGLMVGTAFILSLVVAAD
jgi:hypothetical protein